MSGHKSIQDFAQRLVRTPSQADHDDPAAIINLVLEKAKALGVPMRVLKDKSGKPLALVSEIKGVNDGPCYALNACLDTAPVGTAELWSQDPFSGEIDAEGWLHGRGSSDSKMAVSIFLHIAKALMRDRAKMKGSFLLIFDADEHTGKFGGIKRVIEEGYRPDGLMIGYPGKEELIIGSRGFARYQVKIQAKAEHSGSGREDSNEMARCLADLFSNLSANPEHSSSSKFGFPKKPKVTVTGVNCGDGYSATPSEAIVNVDVRLTYGFNKEAADTYMKRLIEDVTAMQDRDRILDINLIEVESQPAYVVLENAPLRVAMREAIKDEFGAAAHEKICSPSNIGCYLSTFGIETTAGFGVGYEGLHARDEKADCKDIPVIYNTYLNACRRLLGLADNSIIPRIK